MGIARNWTLNKSRVLEKVPLNLIKEDGSVIIKGLFRSVVNATCNIPRDGLVNVILQKPLMNHYVPYPLVRPMESII